MFKNDLRYTNDLQKGFRLGLVYCNNPKSEITEITVWHVRTVYRIDQKDVTHVEKRGSGRKRLIAKKFHKKSLNMRKKNRSSIAIGISRNYKNGLSH